MLWVSTNGLPLMTKLGYKPVAYLSYVKDEHGDIVSGFELPENDALAAIALIIEFQITKSVSINAYIAD